MAIQIILHKRTRMCMDIKAEGKGDLATPGDPLNLIKGSDEGECDKSGLCAADWGITTLSLIAQSAKGMWSVLIRRTLLPSWGCGVITISLGLTTHTEQYHSLSCEPPVQSRSIWLQLHNNIMTTFTLIMKIIKLFALLVFTLHASLDSLISAWVWSFF